MKKFLTTAFIVAFGAFVLSAAKAEVSLSGYQEFYMGSADKLPKLFSYFYWC